MRKPKRKFTDEEKAVLMTRTGKDRIGVFGWLLERGYITRDSVTKVWKLNDAGLAWFTSWENWKP